MGQPATSEPVPARAQGHGPALAILRAQRVRIPALLTGPLRELSPWVCAWLLA